MCPFTSLCSFILIVLSVVNASSADLYIVKIPLTRIPNPNCPSALYNSQLGKRDDTVYVEKFSHYYVASVLTSSGSSTFNLLVDTGTAYSWVGAMPNKPYVQGPVSTETPQIVEVSYAGNEIRLRAKTWLDSIVLGGLTIYRQPIGVPIELNAFPEGIDGILGLGPTILNAELGSDGRINPTVVDNLYNQRTISYPVLGVYLMPTNVRNVGGGGLLSFGAIDDTVLTSDVKYVSVTQTYRANQFWGVDASSLVYGNMPISGPVSGFLDTGSPRISLPNDAFMAYKTATGATIDVFDHNQQLSISENQYNNLQILSILIGDQSYDLSPNAQIYPRASPNEQIFLVINSIDLASEVDFRLGYTFIQRYYVVFNSSSSQIGFASHLHTDSTTN